MAQCLRFIVSGDDSDEKAIKILKQAAKEAGDAEIDVGWLDFEEIERDPGEIGSQAVIVCETFQGEKFETLKSQGRRIVGPACVLHCLRNIEPLPGVIHPIMSLSMLDVVACCTNISIDERSKLKERIVSMGGIMIGDFTQSVTHLIAGEVGSKKYKVACDIGIPVMQQSWVLECWRQSRYKVFQSRDEIVEKHLCPCFKGLTICVTGLDSEVRNEVAKLTVQNGGKYSGELNMRTCTHLIVQVAQGEKYTYARQWKIHCVSPEWFYCCLKEGHWVEESGFEIVPGEESRMDSSKILEFGKSVVDMTTQSYLDCSVMSSKAEQVAKKSMQNRENGRSVDQKIDVNDREETKKSVIKLRTFNTSDIKLTGIQMQSNMLLDGCKIYLSGMPQDLLEQIRRLINTAGGMRFNMLSSNVTHIIIGDVVSTEIYQFLEGSVQKPFVVSPNWLLDSCRMGEVLGEEGYSLLEKGDDPVIMAKPSRVAPRKGRDNIDKRSDSKNTTPLQFDDDLDDEVVFGQYLPQAESSRIFAAESKIPATKEPEKEERVIDQLQTSCNAEAIAGPELEQSAESTTLNNETFHHCKFVVKFFEKETAEQVKSLIQEVSGKIVSQDARADYVVVPLTFEKKRRIGKKEVTICWLEQSIEAKNLLDKNSCFLFRPFHLPSDCLPLKDAVMTVSQFSGIQREHIIQLGDLLGALMQDSFVRKAANDLLVNTHLLLEEASGPKYEAACKWGVMCVTKEWLFACAENKMLMPVEEYPLLEEKHEDSLGRDVDKREGESKATEYERIGDGKDVMRTDGMGSAHEIRTEKTTGFAVVTPKGHLANEGAAEISNTLDNNFPANENGANSHVVNPDGVDPGGPNLNGINPDGATAHGVDPPVTPSSRVKPLLQLGETFKPSFDLGDMMEYLKSPATCFTPRTKSRAGRSSFAFDEFVGKQLRKALEITSGKNDNEAGTRGGTEQQDLDIVRTNTDTVAASGADIKEDNAGRIMDSEAGDEKKREGIDRILEGVVVVVSKKLSDYQAEIYNLASLLGADYRYVYEDSCTHLIHKGKVTDNLVEVKQARSQGKFIVSRHWLDSCLEKSERVEEELFPSTYNPKMSLSVVAKGRKSTRASTARSSQRTKTDKTLDSSGSEEPQKSTRKSTAKNAMESNAAISSTADAEPDDDTKEHNAMQSGIAARLSKGRASPPALENTSSLDARLEFKRQIEEFMEATKGSKGGILRNRRQLLSLASPNEESSLKRSSVARRLRSRQSSQKSNSESSRSSGERRQNSKVANFPTLQPSQGDLITYDDPAGRQERERILAQLKAASPSQDGLQSPSKISDIPVDHIKASNPAQAAILTEDANQDWVDTPSKPKPTNSKTDCPYDIDHLSTPPHRPISMHIANPVQQPAPVNLLDENDLEENANEENKVYKFILSAMTPQEKIHYSAMIEELGGLVCDSQYFTSECSHVIVGTPNRNEKYLASVAAGKWVLHKSYLEASREAGFFVAEESHEWGTEQEPTKLTLAVRRWRKKLSSERKVDPSAGAFKGWHVLLCVGSSVKQQGFKRMLEAGGGLVGNTHPPFKNIDGITHAFIDSNKAKPGLVDYHQLYSAGIWVLRPEYIADYLMLDPPPPTLKYVISEVQKLMETESTLSRSGDAKKRKNDEAMSSQKMKRTKK